MNKANLTIPNILSLSRIVFLPLLYYFVFTNNHLAFTIAYIFISSTDFFDGLIARKWNQITDIGKTLDSVADILLYVSTAFFLYRLYPQYLEPNNALLIAFFSLFFLSFIVSFVMTGKPILMHTSLLRMQAVLIGILVVASYFLDTTYFVAFILLIYFIAFVEEMAIFIKYGQVDPDTPSILTLIKAEKENQSK